MAHAKSNLSNIAVRILLQEVGKVYDAARGLPHFIPTKSQKQQIYKFFDNRCAYCNELLDINRSTIDHLIPINQTALGLNAWGNVVASCHECNKKKQDSDWQLFLRERAGDHFDCRKIRIEKSIANYKYSPEFGLQYIAKQLYKDIGVVCSALIKVKVDEVRENVESQKKSNSV